MPSVEYTYQLQGANTPVRMSNNCHPFGGTFVYHMFPKCQQMINRILTALFIWKENYFHVS